MQTGAFDRLKSFAEQVVAFLKARHFTAFLPPFLYYQAQAHNALGETDIAWAALHEALALCERKGIRWKKWQMLTLLAEIAERRNEHEAATQLWEQARETVTWVAEQIDSGELIRFGFTGFTLATISCMPKKRGVGFHSPLFPGETIGSFGYLAINGRKTKL